MFAGLAIPCKVHKYQRSFIRGRQCMELRLVKRVGYIWALVPPLFMLFCPRWNSTGSEARRRDVRLGSPWMVWFGGLGIRTPCPYWTEDGKPPNLQTIQTTKPRGELIFGRLSMGLFDAYLGRLPS